MQTVWSAMKLRESPKLLDAWPGESPAAFAFYGSGMESGGNS
jgi:hypothetical protein